MSCNIKTYPFALLKYSPAILLFLSSVVMSAVPGLPFTENFTDKNLNDPDRTTARWSNGGLTLNASRGRSGVFTADNTDIKPLINAGLQSNDMSIDDVNGDSYPDLLFCDGFNSSSCWLYLNNKTNDAFNGVSPIQIAASSGADPDLGDINGDGLPDLVYGHFSGVSAILNNGTDTPFIGANKYSIYSSAANSSVSDVRLGDLDNDGDLDLVIANSRDSDGLDPFETKHQNLWFINSGGAQPLIGAGVSISLDKGDSFAVGLVDYNNDGYLDIVIGGAGVSAGTTSDSTTKYYLNNQTISPFNSSTISNALPDSLSHSITDIEAGDVNNDGYADLYLSAFGGGSNDYLYLHDGTTNTNPYSISPTSIVFTDSGNAYDGQLVDIDHDGDLDILGSHERKRNEIYFNDGSSAPFKDGGRQLLSESYSPTFSIQMIDIDLDGDLDIVEANEGSTLIYYNNETSVDLNKAANITIPASTSFSVQLKMKTADFNNDGSLDIIAYNKLILDDNDPNTAPFSSPTDVSLGTAPGANQIVVADFNNDGWLDMVRAKVTGLGAIPHIFLNTLNPAAPFTTTPSDFGVSVKNVRSVDAADVNFDGRVDLIIGAIGASDNIKLYINDGVGNPFDTNAPIDIAGGQDGYITRFADIDNDGDLDIIATVGCSIDVYLNDRTAASFATIYPTKTYTTSSSSCSAATDMKMADLDNDGDLDAVTANDSGINHYYLNDGIGNPFDTIGNINGLATSSTNTREIELVDLNKDGFVDIVSGNHGTPSLIYFNNGSALPFENVSASPFTTDIDTTDTIAVADFDHDGDMDLLTGNISAPFKLYYNNSKPANFTGIKTNAITTGVLSRSLAVGDIDNDGDVDLIHAGSGVNKLYKNNGGENPFEGVTAENVSNDSHTTYTVVLGDVNHDGKLDAVFANFASAANTIVLNDGDLSPFDSVANGINFNSTDNALSVAVADLNMDGFNDLVLGVYNNVSVSNKIYLHTGNNLSPYSASSNLDGNDFYQTWSIKVADFDNNGFLDIVSGNVGRNRLYLNDGTAFDINSGVDITTDSTTTYDIAIGDINGDGKLDVVAGNAGVNRLYLNDGVGSPFDSITGSDIGIDTDTTYGVALTDIDRDGDLDLIASNNGSANKLYLNNGTSTPFNGVTAIVIDDQGTGSNQAVLATDMDIDGSTDVVIADSGNFKLLRSIPFDNAKNKAASVEVDNDVEILKATLTTTQVLPPNTSAKWFMSNNGGNKYYQVTPGNEFVFPTFGDDLRWRVELGSASPLNSPRINSVQILDAKFDHDLDLISDDIDLCVGVNDPDQFDADLDAVPGADPRASTSEGGDACDDDDDNDGVIDNVDLFPFNVSESGDYDQSCLSLHSKASYDDPFFQTNTSGNDCADAFDTDDDNDGVLDVNETVGTIGSTGIPYSQNSPPLITGSYANLIVNADTTFSVIPPAFSDSDGDILKFSLINNPSWLSINPDTGALSGAPTNDNYDKGTGATNVFSNVQVRVTEYRDLNDNNQADAGEALQFTDSNLFSITINDTRAPLSFTSHDSDDFNEAIAVTIFCAEFNTIGSGCEQINYSINNAAFITVTASQTTIPLDATTDTNLRYYSVDFSGNSGVVLQKNYNFDLVDPNVSITDPDTDGVADDIITIQADISTLSGTSSDVESGIQTVEVQLYMIENDGTYTIQTGSPSFVNNPNAEWLPVSTADNYANWQYVKGSNWLSDHSYIIRARATDNAGNQSIATYEFIYHNPIDGKASTTLTSNLANQGVLRNSSVYVEVDFDRVGELIRHDISNTPINLHITGPASFTADIPLITDANGLASINLGLGVAGNMTFDTAGRYTVQAQYAGNAQMLAVSTATFNLEVYDDELQSPQVDINTINDAAAEPLLASLGTIDGSSIDTGSKVEKVEISFSTTDINGFDVFADGFGNFIATVPQWFPVTSTSGDYFATWSYDASSLSLVTDKQYEIEFRATDFAGNTGDNSHEFVYFLGSPAATSLALQLTGSDTPAGATLGTNIKLVRTDKPNQDQTGKEVTLTITHPNGTTTTTVNLVTDAAGEVSINLGSGGINNIAFDTAGTYVIKASFAGNIQMAAADSVERNLYVYVDETGDPNIAMTTPNTGLIGALTSIIGTSSDTGSGVKTVRLQITDGTNSVVSAGQSLVNNPVPAWLPVNTSNAYADWTYNSNSVIWVDDTTYTITAQVIDFAGNSKEVSQSFVYFSDISADVGTSLTLGLTSTDIVTAGTVGASVNLSRDDAFVFDSLLATQVTLQVTAPDNSITNIILPVDSAGQASLNLGVDDYSFSSSGTYRLQAIFAATDQLLSSSSAIAELVVYDVEQDNPAIAFTSPTESLISSLAFITGTSSDAGSGIKKVEIQITDGFDSVITEGGDLSNDGFTDPVWLNVVSTDATNGQYTQWSYTHSNQSAWVDDQLYTLTARATDYSGNVTVSSRSFTFYGAPASTTSLDITLTSSAIANGGTTDASLTLTRDNKTDQDQTGQLITLRITDPDSIQTDVDVLTNFSGQATVKLGLVGANNIEFNKTGVYIIDAIFAGTLQMAPKTVSTSVLVGSSAGYAVIVQGKLPNESGLESHNKTANRIYDTLKDRGFVDQDIHYFNYDATQNGVDAVPTKAAIQAVIEGLNVEMESRPAPVYVIMVDHGGELVPNVSEATFYLDTETITPSELNSWLSILEGKLDAFDQANLTDLLVENKRVIIMGACYSGGFVPTVSSAGRIVISSASEHEQSYKGPTEDDGIRVGEYFLEELFLELSDGNDLRASFQSATTKTEQWTRGGDLSANSANGFNDDAVQHPLLDDNADNVGTNAIFSNSSDGQLAKDIVLGFNQDSLTNDAFIPADIDQVSDTLYLDSNTSTAQLQLFANDPFQVNQAYVEIRTPGKTLNATGNDSSEQLSNDFIRKAFTPPVTSGSPYTLDYDQFVQAGQYEIFYYVNDRFTGALSPAKRSLVYKDRAPVPSANIPPAAFTLLSPGATTWNGTDTQKTILTFDWQDALDTDLDSKVTYTLQLSDDVNFDANSTFSSVNSSNICSASTALYKQEELTSSSTFINESGNLCDDHSYYWRVIAVDEYGQNTTSSDVFIFHTDNTNAQIGTIVAMVQSNVTNAQLIGANVQNQFAESASEIAVVQYNGNYVILTSHVGESQTISTVLTGYAPVNISNVTVADRQTVEVLISMNPDVNTDSDSDVITDVNDNCPVTSNAGQENFDGDAQGDACDADDDNDGMSDTYETNNGLNPLNAADATQDPDLDGVDNVTEALNGTDPNVQDDVYFPDTDGDTVTDNKDNCINTHNTDQLDTNSDGEGNDCDADDDGDGMSDEFEVLYGLNPIVDDASGDVDGDGYTNLEEFNLQTNPNVDNPDTIDTDGDTVMDINDNCVNDSNLNQSDIDLDTVGDACDSDIDNDGVLNASDAFPYNILEQSDNDLDCTGDANLTTSGNTCGDNSDTDDDNDGMPDAFERAYGFNPLSSLDSTNDPDGDGLDNFTEYGLGTSPVIDNSDLSNDDGDTLNNANDNCPLVTNEDQANQDNDSLGDLCDDDRDGDGVANASDAFADDFNESSNNDGDSQGDNADSDDDNDGMSDAFEILYSLNPLSAADASLDPDSDGLTNLQEFNLQTNPLVDNNPSDTTDSDGDGQFDFADNCPATTNADQADLDSDGVGDACDPDRDNDNVANTSDAYPDDASESSNFDGDSQGDNVDTDDDNDGMSDAFELAYNLNPKDNSDATSDIDLDGLNNLQEFLAGTNPQVANTNTIDTDSDGVVDVSDNCINIANLDQSDIDNDSIGDLCDNDRDNDNVTNALDTYPDNPAESANNDNDSLGDNADTDDDNDLMSDAFENLYGLNAFDAADALLDTDSDGLTNLEEFQLGTNPTISNTVTDTTDSDGDGKVDQIDNCPSVSNASQVDQDGDSVGDACDSDRDNDNVPNGSDLFPDDATEAFDFDGDATGDNADTDDDNDGMTDDFELLFNLNPKNEADAAGDNDNDGLNNKAEFDNGTNPNIANSDTIDTDLDGVTDVLDNCPSIANALQTDTDGDSVGDDCDNDRDNDNILNTTDLFPDDATESSDFDADGIGDNTDDDDDNDGMNDAYEALYALNPKDPSDAGGDPDQDGFTNLEEFSNKTSPRASNAVVTSSGDSGGGGGGLFSIPLMLMLILIAGICNVQRIRIKTGK